MNTYNLIDCVRLRFIYLFNSLSLHLFVEHRLVIVGGGECGTNRQILFQSLPLPLSSRTMIFCLTLK